MKISETGPYHEKQAITCKLLRNTWEEDRNFCASLPPQSSGKDREEENDSPNTIESNYSGTGNVSSSSGNALQSSLLNPIASTLDTTDDTVAQDLQEDFMSTDLWCSEEPHNSRSMSTTFFTDPRQATSRTISIRLCFWLPR